MNKPFSRIYFFLGLLFSTCLIISNIIEQKLVTVGFVQTTAGLLIFPVSYIINDLVAEVWGYRAMRTLIWYGFLMNFLAVAIFQIAIYLPVSADFNNQPAFALILGSNTLRITIASFIAFLLGSFLNAYVMSKMKIMQCGRGFSIRAVISTLVGEGADSVVFFFIAFVGQLPLHALFVLIITQIIMKTLYEIIILPLTVLLVKKIKQTEGEDIFDHSISYNPFHIKQV